VTTEDESPIYRPGDGVYGIDPFKGPGSGRPWLVLSNHEGRPFHGQQYIALTLTTMSWLDGLIDIPESSWIRGGAPEPSRIVPWGVQSIGSGDVEHWQGRLDAALVSDATEALIDCLRPAGSD